jgi:hypothetical protein
MHPIGFEADTIDQLIGCRETKRKVKSILSIWQPVMILLSMILPDHK